MQFQLNIHTPTIKKVLSSRSGHPQSFATTPSSTSSVFTMFEAASNMNEDDAKAPSQESVKTSTEDNAKENKESVATEDEAESSFVKLEFKLVDWSFMDFSRVVSTDTSVQSIKETIKLHHGGKIKRLTLCLDCYQEANELRNDQLSLKEAGIIGGSKNEPIEKVMFYDFTPVTSETGTDPILMC